MHPGQGTIGGECAGLGPWGTYQACAYRPDGGGGSNDKGRHPLFG